LLLRVTEKSRRGNQSVARVTRIGLFLATFGGDTNAQV
jgi:hypothetical protein